ncbi:Endoglucanase EG-1 [Pelomyxa schiedti]|nr:Endoglucanase EG-1 [Pelomyxa schiedti]
MKSVILVLLAATFVALVGGDCVNDVSAGTLTVSVDGKPEYLSVVESNGAWGNVWPTGTSLKLGHGPRVYLATGCPTAFGPTIWRMFSLLGKTVSYTVDLSAIGCACNLALYLAQMPAYNGYTPDPTTCGDYYCDANKVCGIYCPEMDIMEANAYAFDITPHKCDQTTYPYYYCDGGGCGKNTYKLSTTAYGPGTGYTINTQQAFQVNITFVSDGTNLVNIVTILSQGFNQFRIEHADCGSSYLSQLTQPLKDGMTLVMSSWGQYASDMAWLDIPPCDYSTNCNNGNAVFSSLSIY